MLRFLNPLTWVRELARFFGKKKTKDVARKILDMAEAAIPIVEAIARATPTRTDDRLIALFKEVGVPHVEKWLAFPEEERGPALLEAATHIMRRSFPNEATAQLHAAIHLALVKYRLDLAPQSENN